MEELLQGLLFVLQELDVVNQQDIHLTVAAFEGIHAAFRHGGDEVRNEFLRVYVLNFALVVGASVVANAVQQVGFAQA